MIQYDFSVPVGVGEHPVEAGSVGFNFGKSGGPVALAIIPDSVEFRGISFDSGICTLSLTGLDPTLDYAVYSCSDLVAGDWSTYVCDVPDDGQVSFTPNGTAACYRVELRK